ncbi:MAG: apolipoprotein N-acyltransferase, partial [Spirochaetales bacterium]|nr:apolipoprotein N-acyltransferase [Spirochaetales bacterium]
SPKWRVALIQHNSDTWKGGIITYEKNFRILRRLSLEAVKENADIVIWSETAFVPGVDWHSKYRTDKDRYALVNDLKKFLATQDVPYLIGNDDGQLKNPDLPPVLPDDSYNRVDYNAVLLYEDGRLKDTYRKVHLVPFTESFPYKKTLPGIYQILVDNGYHFWERGTEFTVFETGGVKFSTPICFEDVFGYLSREFVNNGAEVIVNMTNDSWSGSLSSQMQHLGMAVFRAIENRRSLVRSANSGMTGVIDPDGRIVSLLAPFTADYLVADVPVYTERSTLYTAFGDWFAFLSIFLSLTFIFLGAVRVIIRRITAK